MRKYSPLRYPGGKSVIFDLMDSVIKLNNMQRWEYAEPYAGGCGLALSLLFHGRVSNIHINDLDRGIWAFWDAVLNNTEDLVASIKSVKVNLNEWFKQKEIVAYPERHDDFTVGFATFFLNRTNRSGIIKNAGPIGGLDQDGNYKIDCRFNKIELISRIERIRKYKNRINLSNLDAIKFMKQCEKKLPEKMFYYIDPPYFEKGSTLYTNFYNERDHEKLAKCILGLSKPWILTYDNKKEIKKLYSSRRQLDFSLNYSVARKYEGNEVLIHSKGMRVPEFLKDGKIAA